MKRLLVFAAAAGMAVSLFADRSFLSGTGFERYYDAGPVNLPQEAENGVIRWNGSVGEDMATITNYDSVVTAPVTPETYFPTGYEEEDYLTNGENSQYLALDTGSSVLTRTLQDGNASIGDDGLYVDTFVQFTASDTEPSISDDDQILVWLHADPENAAVTNLVITAGYHYLDGSTARTLTRHYRVEDVEIKENEWYRLTIVASVAKYIGYDTAQFKVYVGDKQVEGAYLDENSEAKTTKIFPSLKWKTATLQSVGFAGQGAVDNIVVGTETPFPLEAIEYTITPSEGVAWFTYQVGEGDVETVDPAAEVTLTATSLIGQTITITPKYADGYQGEETISATITVVEGVGSLIIDAYTSVFTVTIDGDDTDCATFSEVLDTISGAESATIKLNGNYTLEYGDYLEIENKSITLDLNGKTLQASDGESDIIAVLGDGSLVLKDSAGGGVLKFADEVEHSEVALIFNQQTLTIGVEGGSNNFTLSNGVVRNDEGAALKIYGGQFSALPVDADFNDITDFTDICPDGYTLEKADGAQYYVLTSTSGGGETEETSVNILDGKTYNTAAEAQAAAAAYTAPAAANLTADQLTTYKTYVKAQVTDTTVNVVLVDDSENTLQKEADTGSENIAAALSGDGTSVSVPAIPGLYYSIESGSDSPANLTEGDRTLATSGNKAVTFTITKDADKGFYRVKISPVDKKQ